MLDYFISSVAFSWYYIRVGKHACDVILVIELNGLRKVFKLVTEIFQLHCASTMFGPLMFPEIMFSSILVHVRPLSVQFIKYGVKNGGSVGGPVAIKWTL